MNKMQFKDTEIVSVALFATAVGWYIEDWIGGAALLVLWLGFKLLVTGDRIPVLFLAFLYSSGCRSASACSISGSSAGRCRRSTSATTGRWCSSASDACSPSRSACALGVNYMRRGQAESSDEERPIPMLSNSALYTAYVIATISEGSLLQLSYTLPFAAPDVPHDDRRPPGSAVPDHAAAVPSDIPVDAVHGPARGRSRHGFHRILRRLPRAPGPRRHGAARDLQLRGRAPTWPRSPP